MQALESITFSNKRRARHQLPDYVSNQQVVDFGYRATIKETVSRECLETIQDGTVWRFKGTGPWCEDLLEAIDFGLWQLDNGYTIDWWYRGPNMGPQDVLVAFRVKGLYELTVGE